MSLMKLRLKLNTYEIVMRAVEEGVSYGLNRADKHASDPLTEQQRERVQREVEAAVSNALSEVVIMRFE